MRAERTHSYSPVAIRQRCPARREAGKSLARAVAGSRTPSLLTRILDRVEDRLLAAARQATGTPGRLTTRPENSGPVAVPSTA